MWIQQVFGTILVPLLTLQQITAVVNNGGKVEESSIGNITKQNDSVSGEGSNLVDSSPISDSLAESSDLQNRREAPHIPNNSYGAPIPSNTYGSPLNSYSPPTQNNLALPIPVYGTPDVISNFIYPAPPPDIPPPAPFSSHSYGAPQIHPTKLFPHLKLNTHFSRPHKLLPKPVYGPPQFTFPVRPHYGPPFKHSINFHKFKHSVKHPKPIYGPPKSVYIPHKHTFTYGVPQIYSPPIPLGGPPKTLYGPPPTIKYGAPPDPIPHAPPPGIPAPPTPPDIKYDGWQPIPGLVSRPPSGSYGSPEVQHVDAQQYSVDLIPPPSQSYSNPSGVKDSYNAPLNTVTGSGGIISSSGVDHDSYNAPLNTFTGSDGIISSSSVDDDGRGIGTSAEKENVSVIKSIGYEIISMPGIGGVTSYSTAPLAYTSDSYNLQGGVEGLSNSISSSSETSLSGSNSIGLVPPSGVYGVPPNGMYGTPIIQNNINLNPPKNQAVFSDHVSTGFVDLSSLSIPQKDAHINVANVYQAPPIPNLAEVEPSKPSTLYTLPTINPTSFQSFAHSSSSEGFNVDVNSAFNYNNLNIVPLTSYTAPLSVVDGSYGLPHPHVQTSFATNSELNNFAINHASPVAAPYIAYQSAGHDCSQKSLPLPQLSFGVPAANSYTASLASLNTNIAGAHQGSISGISYGVPDLQTAYSQKTNIVINSTDTQVQQQGRSNSDSRSNQILESVPEGSELVKSQSVDLNTIPLKGALGSYTLQIQSADGGESRIPHNQVLNDGLLQSILNAIEQPQENAATILTQPLLHLQQIPPKVQQGQDFPYQSNTDKNSNTKNIIVTPPPLQRNVLEGLHNIGSEFVQLQGENPAIDSNEVALYFNNNQFTNSNENIIRNAPQYEGTMAFTSEGNSSYVYEDAKPRSAGIRM
ncbi:hypothetical protein RI129_012076 [Pyrocoelia pectoralis]|uniref:Uncharacterized protein n=1 Tax=Pyrocoelia pectoralis TaxID=417401 RepID=A0AAN7V956_9COLE